MARAAGAKDHALARRYAKAGILMSVGFSAAEVLLTAIFREQIGLVYTDDAAVIAIASQFLILLQGSSSLILSLRRCRGFFADIKMLKCLLSFFWRLTGELVSL